MIPPLPPPMPPWPGGKPPWERKPEEQKPQQPPPQQQAAPQPRPQPQFPVRPQVVHGLVPPQMLTPTLPFWITPRPYFRPTPPQQAQLAQQPPPQPQPPPQQAQQPAVQQEVQQTPAGPVRVERTEENSGKPQPFRPVLPVASPGLPQGARNRDYWT